MRTSPALRYGYFSDFSHYKLKVVFVTFVVVAVAVVVVGCGVVAAAVVAAVTVVVVVRVSVWSQKLNSKLWSKSGQQG